MAYFDFPHTRNYDSDLAFLIDQYKELLTKVNTYIAIEKVTFADPIQWQIGNTYARFTIVMNGTIAYMSVTSVPADVQITNAAYWTEVADFYQILSNGGIKTGYLTDNAVTYAKLSADLQALINSKAKQHWYDASILIGQNDIGAAINAIVADYDVIYFPAGTYNISTMINTGDNLIRIVADPRAVINVTAAMDYVITAGSTSLIPIYIDGLRINCNNKASGIHGIYGWKGEIRNCIINEPTTYGILISNGAGVNIFNNKVYFNSVNAAGIGVFTDSPDQIINQCTVINAQYGFMVQDSTVINDCDVWTDAQTRAEGCIAYRNQNGKLILNNCTMDTVAIGVSMNSAATGLVANNCRIINNNGVWASPAFIFIVGRTESMYVTVNDLINVNMAGANIRINLSTITQNTVIRGFVGELPTDWVGSLVIPSSLASGVEALINIGDNGTITDYFDLHGVSIGASTFISATGVMTGLPDTYTVDKPILYDKVSQKLMRPDQDISIFYQSKSLILQNLTTNTVQLDGTWTYVSREKIHN